MWALFRRRPWQDLTLRLLLAQRYELGESPLPGSQLEAADDAYRLLGMQIQWTSCVFLTAFVLGN